MRNISTRALILSTKPKGESNRLITLLTPEDGILQATLYGGPKSKLRAQVSPMNSGIIYLYKDEVKKAIKINDFDVKNYHLSFRESLYKSFAANLAVEILMKSHCAGNSEEAWILLNGFLDGADYFGEEEAKVGLVRFLWRYIFLLGIQPETSCCCQCGKSFDNGKSAEDKKKTEYDSNLVGKINNLDLSYSSTVFKKNIFDSTYNGFICDDCSSGMERRSGDIEIGTKSIKYLEAIMNLSPKEARNLKIDDVILGETKNICLSIIENAIGTRLMTMESAAGIL